MKNNNTLVQVFAKAPQKGIVKTRLASSIGDELATQFAEKMLHCLLQRFLKVSDVQCWVAGSLQHRALNICEDLNITRYAQLGDDLGQRMLHAMRQGLQHYQKVMIAGSDCLGVTHAIVEQTEDLLDSNCCVFVLAQDGGFVMFAANQSFLKSDFKFKNVHWGTPSVWQDTKRVLEQYKISFTTISNCWDIDTLSDIKKHRQQLPKSLNQFLEENAI